MSNGVAIREASAGDLPELNALEQATFTAHAISPRQMSYLTRSKSAIILVARAKHELAGDGIALVRRHAGGTTTGRIYSIVVAPHYRGRGIAQRLLRRLIDRLKSRHVTRIHLEVEQANKHAVRIYEKLGF